jgi:hypothetical protein
MTPSDGSQGFAWPNGPAYPITPTRFLGGRPGAFLMALASAFASALRPPSPWPNLFGFHPVERRAAARAVMDRDGLSAVSVPVGFLKARLSGSECQSARLWSGSTL